MAFTFFHSKLERYQELVRDGKLSLAAIEMEKYLEEGLQEQDDAAHLMACVQEFDANVQRTIELLEGGYGPEAEKLLAALRDNLHRIKLYAELAAKEEKLLE